MKTCPPFCGPPTKNSKISPPPLWENTMQFTVCKTHKSLTNRWKCKFKKQNKQVCKASLLKSTWDQYDFKRRCQLRMKAKRQKMKLKKSHFPITYLYFLLPFWFLPLIFQKITPLPFLPHPHSPLQKGWGHYASKPVKENDPQFLLKDII